jgi:hypothetical protein
MDLDLQNGRHILAQSVRSAEDAERLVRDRPDDYELVCRVLSMLDSAALCIERGYLDKSLFLGEWASTYSGLKEKVIMLVSARKKHDLDYNDWPWPHFQALADALLGNDVMAQVAGASQALPAPNGHGVPELYPVSEQAGADDGGRIEPPMEPVLIAPPR